jgi:hypothetical protein
MKGPPGLCRVKSSLGDLHSALSRYRILAWVVRAASSYTVTFGGGS